MRKKRKVLVFLPLVALVLFIGFLLVKTMLFSSVQLEVTPVAKKELTGKGAQHLSEAIRYRTVSNPDMTLIDTTQFLGFLDFLDSTYTLCDSFLNPQRMNELSMMYRWEGSNPALAPAVFMAHYDVVPVDAEDSLIWAFPAFEGVIKQDTILGRGALDDKFNLICLLEAAEQLLAEGFQPERTYYLAFGHDEEILGKDGAAVIANHIWQKEGRLSFVMDEGLGITHKMVPGLEPDVAMIAVAEKGYASVELSTRIIGGHSSVPAPETAIDVLAAAVCRLKENKFPARITPVIEGFFEKLGPEIPYPKKIVFANRGIFQAVIMGSYEAKNGGNALIRTTTAPTIFHSGTKDNVVPQFAKATINFRTLPGDSIDVVLAHIREVVDDERIEINLLEAPRDASYISSMDSLGYIALETTIREVFPEALVGPGLFVGATDSRNYLGRCQNIYRFSPFIMNETSVETIHGTNECIPVVEVEEGVRFYMRLFENASRL